MHIRKSREYLLLGSRQYLAPREYRIVAGREPRKPGDTEIVRLARIDKLVGPGLDADLRPAEIRRLSRDRTGERPCRIDKQQCYNAVAVRSGGLLDRCRRKRAGEPILSESLFSYIF